MKETETNLKIAGYKLWKNWLLLANTIASNINTHDIWDMYTNSFNTKLAKENPGIWRLSQPTFNAALFVSWWDVLTIV